jgi:hypothetical protein
MEALLYGLVGFLQEDCSDIYFLELEKEYSYLKNKFQLSSSGIISPKFFKLRPPNFPTIRLSQFSGLINKHQNLFTKIIEVKSVAGFYNLFHTQASEYWDNHFTFGKTSSKSKKKLTKSFIDLIIINVILPLKFCYAKSIGNEINEELLDIITSLKKEKNTIIDQFINLEIKCMSGMESQALLELYSNYCSKNKCLQCVVGNYLIKQ